MKGFDEHLDNYGNPNPGGEEMYSDSEWDHEPQDYYPGDDADLAEQDEYWGIQEIGDGITTDDFDNFPTGREFPS